MTRATGCLKLRHMTAVSDRPAQFSGEELVRLMGLLGDADSAELKATVPEPHQRSVITALGLDPLDAQIRQVMFFDTPDLTLDKAGVVVRARRIQGRGGDSVVKLRPVIPNELPAKLRRAGGFRVEVDALPGGFVCSATMKGLLRPEESKGVLAGTLPVRKAFNKDQRKFFAAHAPEGLTLDDLTPLGPIFVLKLRLTPPELRDRLVCEAWLYPDGSRILELSTRCATGEAFQAAAELRAYLARRDVDLTGEQETKTRKALSYFAAASA
jgi:hypothetical protein